MKEKFHIYKAYQSNERNRQVTQKKSLTLKALESQTKGNRVQLQTHSESESLGSQSGTLISLAKETPKS